MKQENEKFLSPDYPYIIVSELTPSVVREALEAYAVEKEDAFWLKKMYHLATEWNIDDFNALIKRQQELEKDEDEED